MSPKKSRNEPLKGQRASSKTKAAPKQQQALAFKTFKNAQNQQTRSRSNPINQIYVDSGKTKRPLKNKTSKTESKFKFSFNNYKSYRSYLFQP